jgi:glycine/D-amino acid oxidase-like deaminating enzyme
MKLRRFITMRDVIIVGGGLFGSIAGAALRDAGMDVLIIDDGRPRSGSRAAGCLMKPSWLQKMGKDNVEQSFRLLDRLYGLRTVSLKAGPVTVGAEWINPDEVLNGRLVECFPYRVAKVSSFPGGNRVRLNPDLKPIDAKHVIVACGAWTRQLIHGVPVVGKVGLSLRLFKEVEDNRISVWAPYKQLVRFSQDGFHWAGDGTAILEKNWDGLREEQSTKRISDFAGQGGGEVRVGIRPFAQTSDPAALEEVAPGLWSLTGGGKNGTAAAGWAAAKLLERLT